MKTFPAASKFIIIIGSW